MITFRIQILAFFFLLSFVISSTNTPTTQIQGEHRGINFEAWFFAQTGSRTAEGYALYFKQALASIDIDLKIIPKPFGQFVGDLNRQTTAHPFDMAQIRFQGGGPTPSFMWQYHSTNSFYGRSMYQLDDPDFQAWQEIDSGIRTKNIDLLLEEIEFELDLVKKQELVDQFAELFMSDLLYDFPLVSSNISQSMWAGYGGPNNALWIPDEGVLESRMFGAKWGTFDGIRASGGGNSTNLRLPTLDPEKISMDTITNFETLDTPSSDITSNMMDSLFYIDKDWGIHPGLVWNWFVEDVIAELDNNQTNGLEKSKNGHHKFFFRDNAYWSATSDYLGNLIPNHQLDADDMLFTLEILQYDTINSSNQGYYRDLKNGVPYYTANVSSILYNNDTLDVWINPGKATLNDFLVYGKYNPPYPRHILGGDLHYIDENGNETIGTARELNDLGINPQNTEEWKHWASIEGRSLVGPYDLVKYVPTESMSYKAREDYYYPNEWDTTRYYGNGSVFTNIETKSVNLTIGDLGIFAPHINNLHPDAYYWAFADDLGTPENEKPTDQGITTYTNMIIEDIHAALSAFELGLIDVFTPTSIGYYYMELYEEDPNKIVKGISTNRGPELLVFNLLNDHLKKINVRKAIAYVIDKSQLIKIHDGYATRVDSPVWISSESWYKPFPIDYDYAIARDLMRSEGYATYTEYTGIGTPTPPITSNISGVTTDPIDDITSITSTTGTTPPTETEMIDPIGLPSISESDRTKSPTTELVGTELWLVFTTSTLVILSLTRKRHK